MICEHCRVPMKPHKTVPGLHECQECPATVQLTDAAYQPLSLVPRERAAQEIPRFARANHQKLVELPPRLCAWEECGKEFVPTNKRQLYCTIIPCRDAAQRQRSRINSRLLLGGAALLAAVGCASVPVALPAVHPLCEVPTRQVLRSTIGDSLGVFTALVPCEGRS